MEQVVMFLKQVINGSSGGSHLRSGGIRIHDGIWHRKAVKLCTWRLYHGGCIHFPVCHDRCRNAGLGLLRLSQWQDVHCLAY